MLGILMSIIAGAAMSLQGVINTRLGEKIGMWESNAFVQGTAFVCALIVVLITRNGSFKELFHTNWVYLLGGVLGLIITATVMASIHSSSPTLAISIILIAQLATAALIDAFGWFGTEKAALHWQQGVGLALMIAGVVFLKSKA